MHVGRSIEKNVLLLDCCSSVEHDQLNDTSKQCLGGAFIAAFEQVLPLQRSQSVLSIVLECSGDVN